MDLQFLFRASAKASKLCSPKDGNNISSETSVTRKINRDSKQQHIFNEQAQQLVKDIAKLRDFLLSSRKQYINIDHWLDGTCLMSDYERDVIDSQSEALLKSYKNILQNLAKTTSAGKVSEEIRRHREAMIEILNEFIKAVSKIYGEQRAIRVQRMVESRKLLRLENLVTYTKKIVEERLDSNANKEANLKSNGCKVVDNAASEYLPSHKTDLRRRKISKSRGKSNYEPSYHIKQHNEDTKSLELIRKTMHQQVDKKKMAAMEADVEQSKEEWSKIYQELKPEEKVQLEIESKHLREQFAAKSDEIKKLSGKVVEIANLQNIFTEKVIQQDTDIYRIHDVAIHATENIKMGNEAIRQAMKKKAFMRVFIIFTLIVLSFTLLFLDWYNP